MEKPKGDMVEVVSHHVLSTFGRRLFPKSQVSVQMIDKGNKNFGGLSLLNSFRMFFAFS